jgi:hypothetical protein
LKRTGKKKRGNRTDGILEDIKRKRKRKQERGNRKQESWIIGLLEDLRGKGIK